MKIYVDTSTTALADEETLVERVALLGQDDHSAPYSWTGIRNARGELRLILECFSIEQHRRLTEQLKMDGMLEAEAVASADDIFIEQVEHLDQVFGPSIH
jgi:hypothetical protein